MYIKALTIDKFRCFEHAEVEFQYPDRAVTDNKPLPSLPNVNLLLGNNGSGKSAILKAIALSVLSRIMPSSGFLPYMLVRRNGSALDQNSLASIEASLMLHTQDLYPIPSDWDGEIEQDKNLAIIFRQLDTEQFVDHSWKEIENSVKGFDASIYDAKWKGIYDDNAASFFLVGYGATRRVELSQSFDPGARERSRAPRYQRVASIFEDHIGLVPINAALHEFKARGREQECIPLLNCLLPEEVQFLQEAVDDSFFQSNHTPLPYSVLSDGYRAFIGWVVDMLYHMCQVTPEGHKLTELRGIVMVDEIDLHLHPEWQRKVVETVAMTFPNLQFFFSSHSPIVTGTLETANIYITEIEETGAATIRPGVEPVHGLSADQILWSAYFGLSTSRAPAAVDKMNELARKAWQGDKQTSLEYLRLLKEGLEPAAEAVDIASPIRLYAEGA